MNPTTLLIKLFLKENLEKNESLVSDSIFCPSFHAKDLRKCNLIAPLPTITDLDRRQGTMYVSITNIFNPDDQRCHLATVASSPSVRLRHHFHYRVSAQLIQNPFLPSLIAPFLKQLAPPIPMPSPLLPL